MRRLKPRLRFCIPMLLAVFTAQLTLGSAPRLGGISPRGGQIGTALELTFSGDRLNDAEEVMAYQPGISFAPLKVENKNAVRATATITDDCPLGEHLFRIRTRSGISDVRTFWVGQFPAHPEKEPNNDFAKPQKIDWNTTLTGVLENEDIDYFEIAAKKGDRLSIEIEGIRLGNAFFDPYIAILNKQRFELAVSDDTGLLLQESALSFAVPEDGDYVILVRESSYTSNGNCRYRLHVGKFPRPFAVYPLGGMAGQTLDLRCIGDASGPFSIKTPLPVDESPKHPFYAEQDGLRPPSPNWVRVSPFGNVLEQEPNQRSQEATPAQSPLPLAFNGILDQPGDEDWFKFSAKKGQNFRFQSYSRFLRSPIDSIVNLYDGKGKHLGGNDDTNGPDSRYDFTAPADGDFFLRIRDHLKRGGPDFVYRIEAVAATPSLRLSIPQFARRDYQSRQMMAVARGNRFATVINASRSNFGGDLVFETSGMPERSSLHAETMPANINSFPIVFEAAADAPVGGALADLLARHTDPEQQISGTFSQSLDLVMGAPNNTVYYRSVAPKLAVATVEEIPFKIDLVPPSVPLVQNGSINLKVVATRKEGFDAPITVRMLWHPPGTGSQPTVTIPKGKSEIDYPLNANGSAQTRSWKIAVMGESDAGQGQILASSALTPITIAPPYLGMELEMAAVEQGQSTDLVCKLEQRTAFEGKAKVRLYGLPAKAVAEELEITKDTTELVFPITTQKDTPKGQHKNLFCQVQIPESGTFIPHNVGQGGVLRVDVPPPPEKAAPKPKPAVAQVKKKPEKRLSRLQQLRLKAKERRQALARQNSPE